MRTWTLTLSALLLTACGESKSVEDTQDSAGSGGDPLAAALWDSIQGFESWPQPTEWDGVQASEDGTHGDFVQIFGDADTLTAVTAGSDVPDGGILVKCGFESAEDTIADNCTLTAMQKISGYDSEHGDWYWAKFDLATGETQLSGQVSGCFGCHESADADGDFVLYDDVAAAGE